MVASYSKLRFGWVLQSAILAGAYAIVGNLSLWFAVPPSYPLTIWPASGVAFVAVLIYGHRIALGIFVGSILASIWHNPDLGLAGFDPKALIVSTGKGFGAMLQAIVAVYLVKRFAGFPNHLTSERQVFSFLFWAGPISCLVNATLSTSLLVLTGKIPAVSFLSNATTWWVGDTIGIIVFAPLLLVWLHRPYETWKPRRLAVSVPIVIVFALSVTAVAFGSNWERQRLKLQFDSLVSPMAKALEKTLDEHAGILHFMEAFRATSDDMNHESFRAFVARPFKEYKELHALSWNPIVLAKDRAAFERDTARQGFEGFQITQLDADGKIVRAKERPSHTVVQFIEPFDVNKKAFGFDVASDPTRKRALEQARDTGEPTATARIILVQETGEQFGILVFMPVYGKGLAGATLEDRRRNISGYMVGVLRGGDIVKAALQGTKQEGVVYRLLDKTAPKADQLLMTSHSQNQGVFTLEEKGLFGGSMAIGRVFPLDFAGRIWHLETAPDQTYLTRHRGGNAWLILIAGMLSTSLVTVFVMTMSGRKEMLKDLIDKKTSELAQALESEQEFSALQRKFISLASHEFRTPLTIIDGAAQRIIRLKDKITPDQLVERAGKIRTAVERMVTLIDATLYASALDAGKIEMHIQSCKIRQLIEEICDRQGEVSPNHDIRINLDDIPECIDGDSKLLEHVFTNLLSNAVKYAPDAPLVEVTGKVDGAMVAITIKDQGVGISLSDQLHMFERYFRADTAADIKGTGIGLSVCKEFVDMHGGDITVDSVEKEGSSFTIRLPIVGKGP